MSKFYILDDEILAVKDMEELSSVEEIGFEIFDTIEDAEIYLLQMLQSLVERYTSKIEALKLKHKDY
jgi:hypothetical protein